MNLSNKKPVMYVPILKTCLTYSIVSFFPGNQLYVNYIRKKALNFRPSKTFIIKTVNNLIRLRRPSNHGNVFKILALDPMLCVPSLYSVYLFHKYYTIKYDIINLPCNLYCIKL